MKVSVCLASYNGERYIVQQLESILMQLSPADEIIVSDDQSTDSTIDKVRALNDSRIRIFINEGAHGPLKNFEHALYKATGDIIFLSDQDDIWHPDKVSGYLKHFQTYDLVTSDCDIIDENGTVVQSSYFKLINAKGGILYNFYRNSYLGCCMAFNRRVLEKSLPFPDRAPQHDIWIGMIGECFFKPLMTSEKLMSYRRHGNNFSTSTAKSKFSLAKKLSFRINLASGIIGRYLRSK